LLTICSALCLVRFIFKSLLNPAGVLWDSHSAWIRFRGAGHQVIHAALCLTINSIHCAKGLRPLATPKGKDALRPSTSGAHPVRHTAWQASCSSRPPGHLTPVPQGLLEVSLHWSVAHLCIMRQQALPRPVQSTTFGALGRTWHNQVSTPAAPPSQHSRACDQIFAQSAKHDGHKHDCTPHNRTID